MEKYDYRSAVSEDIREYLKNHDIIVTTANRKAYIESEED